MVCHTAHKDRRLSGTLGEIAWPSTPKNIGHPNYKLHMVVWLNFLGIRKNILVSDFSLPENLEFSTEQWVGKGWGLFPKSSSTNTLNNWRCFSSQMLVCQGNPFFTLSPNELDTAEGYGNLTMQIANNKCYFLEHIRLLCLNTGPVNTILTNAPRSPTSTSRSAWSFMESLFFFNFKEI